MVLNAKMSQKITKKLEKKAKYKEAKDNVAKTDDLDMVICLYQ